MINISQTMLIALRALSANKLRSALTTLGIVIGVASVVALVAIGSGATSDITSEIEQGGTNVLTVTPGRMQRGPGSQLVTTQLYYDDYEMIAEGDYISEIAPVYQDGATVKYADKSFEANVSGTLPDYAVIQALVLAQGQFLTQSDVDKTARVAVLGSQAALDLFGNVNPVGRTISIGGLSFDVVGVLESSGTAFGGSDDLVFVPLTTMYTKLAGSRAVDSGQRIVSSIVIAAERPEDINNLTAQVEFILRKQHEIDPAEDLPFTVLSQSTLLQTLDTVTQTLTIFLGAVAGISLLVGGIGIMNIMLVSVTERTREIGLRKAIGARKGDILTQFLIEAITLTTMGGLIGILLGILIAVLVSATGLITTTVSWSSILMAFFFSLAVGLFFGLYPAYRAAGLRPMEALRYE